MVPAKLLPRQQFNIDFLARYIPTKSGLRNTAEGVAKSAHIVQEMESLLSLSFDYLSSYDGLKIRKGLRQLEGLLAQICLSKSTTPQGHRRTSSTPNGRSKQTTKELSSLKDDPAFREFFKLQDGFEWNGATTTILCSSSC